MRTSVFPCLYAWLVSYSHVCLAGDTLNTADRIIGNQLTLVSFRKVFELGFFSPSDDSTYLGIWYYESKPKTVVWVANRDNPVIRYNGVFEIAEDGNLKVLSPNGNVHWSSELKGFSAANRTVMLMDSGNLVLVDNHSGNILWQSFEHPTDTFLPGMKMNKDLNLTCWMADDDPRPGNYTFKQGSAGVNNYIISRNQSQLYWESDSVGETISGLVVHLLTNFTKVVKDSNNQTKRPVPSIDYDYNSTRLWMNSTGKIEFLERVNSKDGWSRIWVAPENLCRTYNYCGNFSSCSTSTSYPCKCLPGFSLRSQHDIGEIGDNGYYPQTHEEGCVRKSEPSRENTTFIKIQEVKVRNPDLQTEVDEAECESSCRNMSSECQAYSYEFTEKSTSTCWIWKTDLTTVEEDYLERGRNLSVRVNNRDIASTPRTCKPCGTYIIPYPLSTGPDCGDPTYSNFSCNNRTDNIMFKSNYTVISINPTKRMFYINSSITYCNKADENQYIEFSSPFHVDKQCYGQALGVNWDPPLEPNCSNSTDCLGWAHSTCNANATGIRKCTCDTSYGWNDLTLSCTSQATWTEVQQPPISRENSTSRLPLILVVVLISIIILGCIIISLYVWKKKMAHKQDRESINRIQGRMFDSVRQVQDLIDLEGLEEKDNEGIGVPYFDFDSILEATDNFSDANKLGRGGYGPVYKGKLQGGQEIAVKRLSNISSQGLQEFKNEVVLIAKLQHRNLVRLRGYCLKGDEKILLYEFMPNKSLDTFIFDPTKSVLLNWPMRFDIILGIARGLLYLHQDSRLRVIHRDLKTSNILLDEEMQPKISDFGLARIFGGKETEANTERVVGTYGYMSPEYALDGLFSIKSDVFSFGVVVLEIIRGKKNTGFYQSEQFTSLLGHAWRLWAENKLLDLMDPSLQETVITNQFIRCAQLSLLCVQDEPSDRPTMSNVVTMLDSETSTLPNPKQPTFFMNRAFSSTASSSKPEISLQTDSTYGEGR